MAGEALPNGWKRITLGEVADFVNGDRGENYPTQSDRVGAGVPFINTGHIEPSGRLTNAGMDYITRDSFERMRSGKVKPGDIVYCLRGSTIGKTAWNHFAEGTIASSLVIVRAKAHSCQAYLYFYLTSPLGKQLAAQHDNGSAQPNLSVRALSKYPLPLPPLDEQRAIAHILGTLDDKIELNRRMSETLEAMARALFKSWFVDFLPVRANMEARNRKARTQTGDPIRAKAEGRDPGLPKPLADLFPDAFEDSELGEIPKWWGVGTLSDVASLNPESWSKETCPEVINYIDLSNVKWGSIDAVVGYTQEDAPSRAQRVLRSGDTIVGTVRPGNGSYAFINADGLTGSTGFAVLRPHRSEYAQFIYLAATAAENIEVLAHLADGGAYPAVRPDIVIATPIIRPRDKVLARFSIFSDSLLARIAQNERESRTLATLRDTLLPKLISGELRVKDAERFANTDYHLAHLRIRTD